MRVVFAGGGTGGHLIPGLCVARELARRIPDVNIEFVGTGRPVEKRMVPAYGFEHSTIPAIGFSAHPFKIIPFLWAMNKSLRLMRKKFADSAPAMVVGLGGYSSVAPVLAARKSGIPTVILEQNVIPGKANKLLAKKAVKIFSQWEQAKEHFGSCEFVHSGNPLRGEIFEGNKTSALEKFGFSPDKPLLTVMGGSLGARQLNDAVLDGYKCFPDFFSSLNILLIAGGTYMDSFPEKVSLFRKTYNCAVIDFCDRMQDVYAATDIILCRAGGTTLAEVLALGIPSIITPASFNFQYENAQVVGKSGAGIILNELNGETLKSTIEKLLDHDIKKRMSEKARQLAMPQALDIVVDFIYGELAGSA